MNLKFRDRYLKAVQALQELYDCEKTIAEFHGYVQDKNVVLTLDIYATKDGENVYQLVKDFVPDFILELGDE